MVGNDVTIDDHHRVSESDDVKHGNIKEFVANSATSKLAGVADGAGDKSLRFNDKTETVLFKRK